MADPKLEKIIDDIQTWNADDEIDGFVIILAKKSIPGPLSLQKISKDPLNGLKLAYGLHVEMHKFLLADKEENFPIGEGGKNVKPNHN